MDCLQCAAPITSNYVTVAELLVSFWNTSPFGWPPEEERLQILLDNTSRATPEDIIKMKSLWNLDSNQVNI